MNKQPDLFEKLKDSILSVDPVYFCQKFLTLEGKPFNLINNGYKCFTDIYRYIGLKALEKDSKPVVLVKGRQVGATTMCSALEMYFMGSGLFGVQGKPPIRIIHAFPKLELAYAYTKTKLNPMITGSVVVDSSNVRAKPKSYMQTLLDKDSQSNDSLQFKQFQGGNHLWIESTGINADRLRGRSADIILFDEVQDMFGEALLNATKILAKASYGKPGDGVQVYFGTPKQKGSTYYQIWNNSSQQYYYLGCIGCEKHFPLYTPGSDDWEQTWLYEYIVRCPHCGLEQDKRLSTEKGKWVATRDPADCDFVGFHINQLYNPEFTKEKILKDKPGNNPFASERGYQNEVLGEFYSGEAGIITIEEIREKCADHGRKMAASLGPDETQGNFLGLDWGGRANMEQYVDSEKIKVQRTVIYSSSCFICRWSRKVLGTICY